MLLPCQVDLSQCTQKSLLPTLVSFSVSARRCFQVLFVLARSLSLSSLLYSLRVCETLHVSSPRFCFCFFSPLHYREPLKGSSQVV